MITLEALHQMPLREKLFVMEALWDDISAAEAELEVPAWQKEVLDVREEAVAAGAARFMDWEVAKKEILEAVK
ncbi:MAG: addiction module protein [Verrucomicrobiaceae bacterium]|nr:addiction module protein [Verrucomicrobiaceae bacterium]